MALLPARRYIRDDSFPVFLTFADILNALGNASLLPNSVLLGEGTNPLGFASPVQAGFFLRDNGPGVDPSFAQIGPPFGRILLSAPTNFYYKPSTGNDNNPGTLASPWASPAPLFSHYDFGNQIVTLNLLENTGVNVSIVPWVGGGTLILDLGGFTINHTGTSGVGGFDGAILISGGALPGPFQPQNGTLTTTQGTSLSNACLQILSPASINFGSGLVFGSSGDAHIRSNIHGTLVQLASYTISGSCLYHILAGGGAISTFAKNITITISANITVSQMVRGGNGANIVLFRLDGANPFSLGGNTVTGQRYFVDTAGVITTNNGGKNFIPGSIDGVANSPGIYQ